MNARLTAGGGKQPKRLRGCQFLRVPKVPSNDSSVGILPSLTKITKAPPSRTVVPTALEVGAAPRSLTAWAGMIRQAWFRGADSTLESARLMSQARASLPYGGWGQLWKTGEMPFSKRKGEKFVAIGQGLGGLDANDRSHLPAVFGALYCLAQLGQTVVEEFIWQGLILPGMSVGDARVLLPERDAKSQRKNLPNGFKARLAPLKAWIRAEIGNWPEEQRKLVGAQLLALAGQPDGSNPVGDLVLAGNTLYGVTQKGGTDNLGAIFSYSIGATNAVILHSFGGVNNESYYPMAGLLLVGSTLYGTTYGNTPANDLGSIFSISTNGSEYAILHTFVGSDGAQPQARLLCVSNILYGTTYSGGATSDGTIFSISTDGSSYQTLYSFGGVSTDGQNPEAGLLYSGGMLHGTTYAGGSNGGGTVFSFQLGGTQDVILHNFTDSPDGANPEAGLLLVSNTLYGTTYLGGSDGNGTVFSIGVDGNGYAVVHSFSSFDGMNPQADLIIQGNALHGTTVSGGAFGFGTVFGIDTDGNFNDIYDFIGSPDGQNPDGGLCSP